MLFSSLRFSVAVTVSVLVLASFFMSNVSLLHKTRRTYMAFLKGSADHDDDSANKELTTQNTSSLGTDSKSSFEKKNEDITYSKNTTSSSCDFVPTQTMPNNHSKPIWIPAYPGSGSAMTGALVRAVTGRGGDDYYSQPCAPHYAATCKTHWPSIGYKRNVKPETLLDFMHDRYVLLIRNPIQALPSFFNFRWEAYRKNGAKHKKSHQEQGPEEAWRQHRDKSFKRTIQNWKRLIQAWRDQPFELAFVMPYEHLIHDNKGPATFQKLVDELRMAGHDNVPTKKDVACLWYRVVKEHRVLSGNAGTKRTQTYIPRFTQSQTNTILATLQQVANEFPELEALMAEYTEDVKNLPIDTAVN